MQHRACVCVHINLLACKCDQMCVCACTCSCVWICVCAGRHSQVSLPSSALKLMIWGPENQQIRPPAGHNGERDLPVDVFEDRSSFFSVNTSLPPHNRRIHYTNARVTPAFTLLMRKCASLCGRECVYAYRPVIILHVRVLWQSVKIIRNFMFLSVSPAFVVMIMPALETCDKAKHIISARKATTALRII